ncbi:MATE family efflux transporter [Clostridia bacterium]|nr:MATE family efflux transporter [Clostridia bacterium]GHV10904.1 MATE family efflux transporter [Clostridia bacterium]
MIGNIVSQFYNMADTIIVGRFVSTDALAAVGLTGSLFFLIIGFAGGMCQGFTIPLARCFGAKDMEKVRVYLANTIYLSLAFVVIITVAMLLTTDDILRLMNTPKKIESLAHDYIFTIFAGLFASVAYNLCACVSRAVGDSRTPLYFLILAAVLNVILDLVFVIAFDWKTFGVGFATVVAQAISAICCFFYMRKKFPELSFNGETGKPSLRIMIELIIVGIPMALQFSITAVGSIILQSAVNTLGIDAIATITAASKAQMILIQPFDALGSTNATYSSQNLGAERLDRIKKGVAVSVIFCAIVSAVAFAIANTVGADIARMFVDDADFTSIRPGIQQFFFINSLFYFALGVLIVLRNTIQGLGYTLPAMIAGVFEMVARASVGVIIVEMFGFIGAVSGNPVAWVAANILLVPVYFIVINRLKRTLPSTKNIQRESEQKR